LESRFLEDSAARAPRRRPRPPRRPERQQILLRRALALGGGLVVVILLVLGVKGCLDARANRALSDYADDVTQIVEETDQTSKDFFGKLADAGSLSVTEFVAEVNADRSAMDNYASRVDGLDAPGDMSRAQEALELAYELRSSAMTEIAEKMPTALGDAGADKAIGGITRQMQKLLAADALYSTVVRPEINGVLADNGIEGSDVPESVFLPEGTTWLEEDSVSAALGAISGSSGAASPGVHGLGLGGVNVNGTELGEGAATVSTEETVEVEVEVENQGESTEEGVGVTVSVGGTELQGSIESVGAGETSVVSIPLTPTPSGEVTLEVEVDTVPGEQVSENNEASYTVVFE
jgi:CARDB